jgi:hypothetical protein
MPRWQLQLQRAPPRDLLASWRRGAVVALRVDLGINGEPSPIARLTSNDVVA